MKKRNEAGGKHIANPAAKKLKEKKPEQIRPIRQFPEENDPVLERILDEPVSIEETAPLIGNELNRDDPEPQQPAEETMSFEPSPGEGPETMPGPADKVLAPEEKILESDPEFFKKEQKSEILAEGMIPTPDPELFMEEEKPETSAEEPAPTPDPELLRNASGQELPKEEPALSELLAEVEPEEKTDSSVHEEQPEEKNESEEDSASEETPVKEVPPADEPAVGKSEGENAGKESEVSPVPPAEAKAVPDERKKKPAGKKSERIVEKAEPEKMTVKRSPVKKGNNTPEPSIPAIILAALLAAALLFLCLLIIKVNMLPIPLVIAIMAVLLGLVVICVELVWTTRKPVRFAVGVFLSIVMIAGLIVGSVMVQQAWKTAQKVTTTVETVKTVVGVYVRADDPAMSKSDLHGYRFGVIKAQDREDTDQALRLLATDLGTTIYVVEYDDVIRLISALYNGQIQSAVFESYHIDLLTSMEAPEYAALAAQARQIGSYTVDKLSKEQSMYLGDIGESPISQKEKTEVVEDNGQSHLISIYMSGIDSFGTVNVKSRSDVNVLVFINTKTHQVLLLNTPRDYYVYTTVSGEYRDKLTHAGLWGPECSMGSLAYLYDCDVEYYFRVNFSGFVDIVTALGGLDVALADDQPVLHFTPEEALLLARDRHVLGGEFSRGIRHMRIIKAMANQILSTDLIYNYTDLLDAVEDSFITSVPYDLIADLVREQIRSNPSWEFITYSVTGYGTSDICYSFLTYNEPTGQSAYVLAPNYDTVQTAHDLIAAMARDEYISEPEKNYKE